MWGAVEWRVWRWTECAVIGGGDADTAVTVLKDFSPWPSKELPGDLFHGPKRRLGHNHHHPPVVHFHGDSGRVTAIASFECPQSAADTRTRERPNRPTMWLSDSPGIDDPRAVHSGHVVLTVRICLQALHGDM